MQNKENTTSKTDNRSRLQQLRRPVRSSSRLSLLKSNKPVVNTNKSVAIAKPGPMTAGKGPTMVHTTRANNRSTNRGASTIRGRTVTTSATASTGAASAAGKRRLATTASATAAAGATSMAGKRRLATTKTSAPARTTQRMESKPGQRAAWDTRGKYEDLMKAYKHLQKEEKEVILEQSLVTQKKVKELEEQLDSTVGEVETLKKEIEGFPALLKEKDERMQTLLADIEQRKVIAEESARQQRALTAERDNLTLRLANLESATCSLTGEREQLKIVLENTKSELDHAQKTIAQLQGALEDSKRQLGEQDLERRRLHHRVLELKGTVRVACRVRPVLPTDGPNASPCHIDFSTADSLMKITSSISRDTVTGEKTDATPYSFKFDNFYGAHSTQCNVFEEIEPLVQSALDGYNVCIFAYGQTGSGKTFTMEGANHSPEFHGMIPRAVNKIFQSMEPMERNGWNYRIFVSFVEIYNDNLRDLLGSPDEKTGENKTELKIVQSYGNTSSKTTNDVEVTNLKVVQVNYPHQVHELLTVANKNRSVGATKCNIKSSRSHSVFQLKLVGTNDLLKETSVGKVNLVDLAGSERLKESQAEGERLVETRHINKSLSALRKVMESLSKKENHIPFRDSKLTHLLQSSLGGNSKSLMFVNISPLEEHFNESVNSLRFAAVVNEVHIGVATQNKKKLAL